MGETPTHRSTLSAKDQIGAFVERISDLPGWLRVVVCVAAGLLSALGMPPFGLVPVFVLGLVLFAWVLDSAHIAMGDSAARQRLWTGAKLGWGFGFGYHLLGLYWIGYAFLVEADAFAWMIPFVVVLMPAGLALFTGLATAVALWLWRPGVARLITLAVFLALSEWLRGHILTGFPWNLFGYVWSASLEIAQSSAVFGAYGLTLVTLVLGLAPAVYSHARVSINKPWIWPAAALCVCALLWGAGAWRLQQAPTQMLDDVRLRIVQPSVPQAEKWRPENRRRIFDLYLQLTQSDGFENITHVVWPESAVPYLLSREPLRVEEIGLVLSGRVLLTGSVRSQIDPKSTDRQFYNSLHIIHDQVEQGARKTQITATYDKVHLVPFGEYMPLNDVMEAIGLKQLAFGEGGYSAGPSLVTLDVPGAPDVVPLICYEIVFPGEVLPTDSNANWLLNLTNDAWFGDSTGPRQHIEMTRFRAIETGRPIVRSANNGISAIIDPLGRVTARLELNEAGVLDGPLPAAHGAPLYARFGDLFFLGAAFLWVVGLSYRTFSTGTKFC